MLLKTVIEQHGVLGLELLLGVFSLQKKFGRKCGQLKSTDTQVRADGWGYGV